MPYHDKKEISAEASRLFGMIETAMNDLSVRLENEENPYFSFENKQLLLLHAIHSIMIEYNEYIEMQEDEINELNELNEINELDKYLN